MNISAIVGVALVSATLIVLIRKHTPEFVVPASVISSILILSVSVVFINEIFEKINEITQLSAVSNENIKVIFKSLGVCYITQIGRDVCRDCGETALGDKVDLAGKITIAAMSLSIITQVVQLITEIVKL